MYRDDTVSFTDDPFKIDFWCDPSICLVLKITSKNIT